MRKHFTKVALIAVVAVAALPVWASSGVAEQDTSQQQEIEQRIQAEITKAMEVLHAELAQLRQELAAISEDRLQESALIVPHLEASEAERERVREMAQHAREMARQATENLRREYIRVEPSGGGFMTLRRSAGAYGEVVIDHAEELGLTETQEEQIHGLRREHERTAIARRADIEVAEMDLEALDEDLDADIAAVRSGLESLAALRIDAQIADRELRRDLRQVLTVEQREQLDEIWDHRRSPMSIAVRRSR